MSKQKELFYMDEYDALREDVEAIGKKELAVLLKGEDCDIDDAARWINNCLDRNRDQKFDTPHYKLIINEARKKGSFAYISYLLRETYFEPPVPKVYEIEVQKVGDRLQVITQSVQELATYVQSLNEQVKK
jgi:hypothetical protein